MTEKQAIRKSINHWKRMIKWVEKEPPENRAEPYNMVIAIKEWWGSEHCALCLLYEACTGCPLDEAGTNCNDFGSTWDKAHSAETWDAWLPLARRLLKQLESLTNNKG